MKISTHAFREAFVSGQVKGFALEFDDVHSRAAAAAPFLTQKDDKGHLRLVVFETDDAAEEERKHFPSTTKIAVKSVSVAEVRAFAAVGYFGMPALAFLRDRNGVLAPL